MCELEKAPRFRMRLCSDQAVTSFVHWLRRQAAFSATHRGLLKASDRHPASGIWHPASGIWHLASGIWHLASGIWHLASQGVGSQRKNAKRPSVRMA
ncbi:hypothetical protein, partial [Kosakonia sp. PSU_27]|uniref:hypothetical protein n=1 Tax=Kosakonia sp. PSU_27 TaxID=3126217 RepID=UPI0031B70076